MPNDNELYTVIMHWELGETLYMDMVPYFGRNLYCAITLGSTCRPTGFPEVVPVTPQSLIWGDVYSPGTSSQNHVVVIPDRHGINHVVVVPDRHGTHSKYVVHIQQVPNYRVCSYPEVRVTREHHYRMNEIYVLCLIYLFI